MSRASLSQAKPDLIVETPSDDQALDEISDKPLFPLNMPEMTTLFKIILKSSLSAGIASLSSNVNGMVCLKFVGGLGDPAMLAGASLANTWGSAFCLGIILSINMGFSVFASQAFGAGQHRRLGLLYQRNLFVFAIIGFPLVLSLLFADSILGSVGLDPDVTLNVGIYLRYLIPSLIGVIILECTKTFLMAQNMFSIGGIVQSITAVLNYFWCYLLVEVFEWSLPGVAIAKSITDITGAIALICYAKYSGKCDQTWIPWDKEALEGWVGYLKATAMIGANLYVEWISYEVSILIAGGLNDKYILGAHGLAISIQIVLFTMCIGNMTALQTYVGNAAGAGSKNKAQKVAFVAFCINAVYVTISTVILLGYSKEISMVFTKDPTTQPILADMLWYYGLAHVIDSYATHMGCLLRTIGKERDVLIRFVCCYVFFALDCEWIFGLALGYSYHGIWLSMISGMYLMFVLMSIELKKFDWDQAIAHIRSELNHGKGNEGEYVEMKELTP